MVLHFARKEKWPDCDCLPKHELWPVVWLDGQKKHHRKLGEKDIPIRNMWAEPSKWTKCVKTLQLHVNAQQKMTSA